MCAATTDKAAAASPTVIVVVVIEGLDFSCSLKQTKVQKTNDYGGKKRDTHGQVMWESCYSLCCRPMPVSAVMLLCLRFIMQFKQLFFKFVVGGAGIIISRFAGLSG